MKSLFKFLLSLPIVYLLVSLVGAIISFRGNPHHPLSGIYKLIMLLVMALTSPRAFWKGLFKNA